jgi:alanine racemase
VNTRPRYTPYIDVHLDNIVHNLGQITKNCSSDTRILAVVKDNSYGCGADYVARKLLAAGVNFFAVASAPQARHLRDTGISSPILIFGPCNDSDCRWAAQSDVHLSCNDPGDIERWAALNTPLAFHLNCDTRMGRLGVRPDELSSLIPRLRSNSKLHCTGIYTHFANADEPGTQTVDEQMKKFDSMRAALRTASITPDTVHCANSAACARFPLHGVTHVRPGIALYGCNPDPSQDFGLSLKPAISLKSSVIKVKRVPAHTPISYGGIYTTQNETSIATVACGYAHGVPRYCSNNHSVLIHGELFPVVGRVTMDYIMVDIGNDFSIDVGDEVVVMGQQDRKIITVDSVARLGNTIGYEVLCGISTAVNRYYCEGETTIGFSQGLLF